MRHPIGDLRLEGVLKGIGDFVLDADLRVSVGERAALVGRSGSGKTSLLRVIAGLEPLASADPGKIFLGDDEITRWNPSRRQIGFVFQDQALFPTLDVMGNVTFGLRMRGVPHREREAQAMPWLERVGLASRADGRVDELSGGEKQRISLIRALIWKPRLLLLDEPFSALDQALREVLRGELLELHKLWPAPMILVTHDQEDVRAIANVRLEFEESGEVRKIRRKSSAFEV